MVFNGTVYLPYWSNIEMEFISNFVIPPLPCGWNLVCPFEDSAHLNSFSYNLYCTKKVLYIWHFPQLTSDIKILKALMKCVKYVIVLSTACPMNWGIFKVICYPQNKMLKSASNETWAVNLNFSWTVTLVTVPYYKTVCIKVYVWTISENLEAETYIPVYIW